jgi:hypothetical protein
VIPDTREDLDVQPTAFPRAKGADRIQINNFMCTSHYLI